MESPKDQAQHLISPEARAPTQSWERVGLSEHTCRLAEWNAAKNRPDWRRRASLSVADSLPQKASPAAMIVCVHSKTCSTEHESHPVGLLQGWRQVKAQGYCMPDSILQQGPLLQGWPGSEQDPRSSPGPSVSVCSSACRCLNWPGLDALQDRDYPRLPSMQDAMPGCRPCLVSERAVRSGSPCHRRMMPSLC